MGELYTPTKIKDGEFGAMMQVGLCNVGPVTFSEYNPFSVVSG